jgi:protein involved in sex pheromone biosynthesis
MKKVLAIFAIASIVVLSSCGNGTNKSTETNSDSTVVAVDSVKVDSAAVSVDSTKTEATAVEVK